jgi:UPI00006C10F2 related cluster
MEKTAVKLVRDKRKAVNSNHDTPVSGMLVYGDNNHKYNLGFVPTIWDDNNEVLIVAHQNSDPLTDTYREPFQLTVVPYEMIQYLHINMDLQNARAIMKEFGFEDKIINLFLNEQAPTTDMYAFGAVRKGELDEIYKLREEQERQAEAALMRLRNEQRSRGIGVPTYDLVNNPKDVPMAGPQTAPSAPVEDTTSDNVPVVQYRLDDPLYDPTAVRRVTRSIDDSYPYPTPNVPDLTYLGVHADETNTGTILPVAPAPTPAPVTPPVSPTPGHGTSGTATPVAPTPTTPSGTGATATPVTPGSTSGSGTTPVTPAPVPTPGTTTPTPSHGAGSGTTPVAPAVGTTVPVTPGSGTTTVTPAPATPGSTTPTTGTGSSTTSPATPGSTSGTGSTGTTPVTPVPTPTTPTAPTTGTTTPTPAAPAPSVPVTPAPTPVNGLSANGAIDLFSKLNKIISDKLAGQAIASSEFDTITPEYTTTASDQISKHDFNTSLGALSTTLANIHGGTAPAIAVAEDANPVESTVVDNLIATVKAMVL